MTVQSPLVAMELQLRGNTMKTLRLAAVAASVALMSCGAFAQTTLRIGLADMAQRKAVYEKLTGIILEDDPKIYLHHRRVLIAHTTRLEGYRQMPDGLVRVVGLKLK
jgi:ABC-type transport system substrate-binding protein